MTVLKGFDFANPNKVNTAEDNSQEEHFLRYVKAGESIQVGLLKPTEYAQVQVYDVYPLTGTVGVPSGDDDLFVKAKAEMFRLADVAKAEAMGMELKEANESYNKMSPADKESFKEGQGKGWYKLITEAYRLATQVRFLFGFYDFETGSPFVMQTTKKQAENIYKKIADAWTPKKEGAKCSAEKFAYTLTKGTGGFSVDVDTDTELAELDNAEDHILYRNQVISEAQFSSAHFTLSVEAQKEVIKKFASSHEGFDLNKVIGSDDEPQKEQPKEDVSLNDISDDDLPF